MEKCACACTGMYLGQQTQEECDSWNLLRTTQAEDAGETYENKFQEFQERL